MTRTLSLLSLFSLLLFAAAANAQTPTAFFRPARGTVTGGDVVTIFVSPCDKPVCPLHVFFGGVEAEARFEDGRVRAVTPGHAPGQVEVRIEVGGNTYLGSSPFTYAGMGTEPNRESYEQILIPVPLPPPGSETPGANGSRWVTELWAWNIHLARNVELFSGSPPCVGTCTVGDSYPFIGPTRAYQLAGVPYPPLFYVQKNYSRDVHFSLHVYDASRGHENSGTQVPVVRESEYRTEFVQLMNVPIGGPVRTSLRTFVFRLGTQISSVYLRIFREGVEGQPLVTDLVSFAAVQPSHATASFPAAAPNGFINDLRAKYPQLTEGRYRIELVAQYGGILWAMATATNNETNLTTVYSPQ